MKKSFITIVIAAIFSVTAFAGDGGKKNNTIINGDVNVTYVALNNFKANFKDVKNATWKITANCQKASFNQDGVLTTAFYDLKGEYLGFTQNIGYTTIPFSAQEEIDTKYTDYPVKEVIKFEYNGENTTIEPLVYFVDMKKGDSEVVLKVTPDAKVTFYKKVK
jgi:hypothetical protein